MVDVFIKVLLFDILFSDIFSLKFSVENFYRKLLSKTSIEIGYDNLIYNYVQILCQTRVIFLADK